MPDNDELIHALRAVALAFDQRIAEFGRARGLGATDVRALIELLDAERRGDPGSPGGLADRLHLGSAAATALVDRLVAHGSVERVPHPTDRRRVLLRVTPSARRLGEAFFAPILGPLRAAAAEMTPTEIAATARFLRAGSPRA